MTDVHNTETRSKNMAAIKNKNTKPELLVRKYLHAAGYRYRLHYGIKGKPDIVFPKQKVALFVNGCFWHGHTCQYMVMPKTNTGFWHKKINSNIERDRKNQEILKSEGWHVIILWECRLRPKEKEKTLRELIRDLSAGYH